VVGLCAGLDAWSELVRDVTDRLHRLPAVGLFHRSRDASLDPEPAFVVALEAARAVELLVADRRFAGVEHSATAYQSACDRLVATLARQYLSTAAQESLDRPQVVEEDHAGVVAIVRRLESSVDLARPSSAVLRDAAERAARDREFEDALRRLTGS
jgi:SpoU rRNA methylase family enzyme